MAAEGSSVVRRSARASTRRCAGSAVGRRYLRDDKPVRGDGRKAPTPTGAGRFERDAASPGGESPFFGVAADALVSPGGTGSLRAGTGGDVRALAHEPADHRRAALGLSPDARAGSPSVLRLPLQSDYLAVVLEHRARLVARRARRCGRPSRAELLRVEQAPGWCRGRCRRNLRWIDAPLVLSDHASQCIALEGRSAKTDRRARRDLPQLTAKGRRVARGEAEALLRVDGYPRPGGNRARTRLSSTGGRQCKSPEAVSRR